MMLADESWKHEPIFSSPPLVPFFQRSFVCSDCYHIVKRVVARERTLRPITPACLARSSIVPVLSCNAKSRKTQIACQPGISQEVAREIHIAQFRKRAPLSGG
jgi:hypothetical protein